MQNFGRLHDVGLCHALLVTCVMPLFTRLGCDDGVFNNRYTGKYTAEFASELLLKSINICRSYITWWLITFLVITRYITHIK